jgi:hypothetical protein
MKRFHVHVSVENLEDSIGFYSTLFAAQPTIWVKCIRSRFEDRELMSLTIGLLHLSYANWT